MARSYADTSGAVGTGGGWMTPQDEYEKALAMGTSGGAGYNPSAAAAMEAEYQRNYASLGNATGNAGYNQQRAIHNASFPSNPVLTGLQTAGGPGSSSAPAPITQIPQQPAPPITTATPVVPAKPRRRMITQSSHSLSGLRAANGAGF